MSDDSQVPDAPVDNDYQSRQGQKGAIPVQKDEDSVEAGGYEDAEKADSDAQLERDESDAIDESNIIDERTRGAKPEGGNYAEPGDEEGLTQ